MRLPDKDRIVSFTVVLALAAVLIVLAVLQYRWSGQVSEAASERMKANLQAAMLHFRDGLAHELGGIALALQFDSQSTAPAVYAGQIEQWKQAAAYPELISNVYIWKADGRRSRFERLNFKTLQFEACAGPYGFERLTEPLQEFASRAATRRAGEGDRPMLARGPRPFPGRGPDPRRAQPAAASHAGTELAVSAPAGGNEERLELAEQLHRPVGGDHQPRQTEQREASAVRISDPEAADVSRNEPSVASAYAWARRSGRGTWGLSYRGSGALERRQGLAGPFSAFGASAERQQNPSSASPVRRPVAVQSGAGAQFSSMDPGSPFNRPFIVPDRLFQRQGSRTERTRSVDRRQEGSASRDFEGAQPRAENLPVPSLTAETVITGAPPQLVPEGRGQLRESGRPRIHLSPWFVETSIPALLRPKFLPRRDGDERRGALEGDWIIVELNRKLLQERVFPELVERYFAGPEGIYDVAVKAASQNELIYTSSSAFGRDGSVAADAQLGILGNSGGPSGPMRVFFAGDHTSQSGPAEGGPTWARRRVSGPVLIPFQADASGGWELLARHRKGSLEAAVAGMRRRNLGISFGVLLILGVTMAMVIVNTRRAQRLATLQMDFVAGVSHELRTPLAVISSAADNIADGIVSDKARLARYGKLIRDHSHQLTDLVEQILSFASTRQQSPQYNLVRVQPAEFLQAALRNSAEMIRSAGITLEQEIAPDLPDVAVDVSAATRCLQNLISNAVKYGGDQRWIAVRALTRDGEVQISVEDKGIGMEHEELRRIFEPFYRAPAVVSAQIRGTGLGLALAKTMAQAFGGRLTATSHPGKGSTFTLHLPCAEEHTNLDQTNAAGIS